MNAIYLWTAYVVGSGAVGATVSFVVSRLLDTRRERRYVPPSVLYTEVRPLVPVGDLGYAKSEPDPVAIPAPLPTTSVETSAWALDALSDVRKTASEDDYATLAEFARPVPTSPALIWAGMVGVRHVQGLVTA